MDKSAQKALIDALTQHQAYLFRASSQSVNELVRRFNSLSNAQLQRLSELLEELTDSERNALKSLNFGSRSNASKRIEEIKTILDEWFTSIDMDLSEKFHKSTLDLAIYEAAYTAKLAGDASVVVAGAEIYKTARKTPFAGGQLVDYLFADIAASLRKKVEYVIRDGISQGQTNQQIVQRIKGKKSLDYKDGLLESSRSSIERQVRTVRSHVSNTSYLQTYEALGFTHIKFVSVLDGRSSFTCANLDQTMWKIDDPKIRRPPLHPNCRSTLIGVDADGNLGGVRPFVADERKIKNIPKDERDGIIGQVEANTKFSDWFKDQDDDFQRNWLGSTRFELYKKSDFPIDKFVDPIGRKYTLDELREIDKKTFENLGL
ncbi:MAG TPA: phage head morphogenesis protein [Acinetobacter lwoffii]|uniref:Phage head morphogenesis protein n=1 Tax=Acinetobacter lwoffii TaxID=28090 RepID=A0A9D2UUU4_ACILW|nr:phage head morphogenesis protein [Acinetobacter lwoffii]